MNKCYNVLIHIWYISRLKKTKCKRNPFLKIHIIHLSISVIFESNRHSRWHKYSTCSLKLKNSYGYDEISAGILKASAPYVSSPLTHISNKILITGTFPDRLKFSEINHCIRKAINQIWRITGPFCSSQLFPKLSKKLFIKDYIPI
jgi:hypothetical protein